VVEVSMTPLEERTIRRLGAEPFTTAELAADLGYSWLRAHRLLRRAARAGMVKVVGVAAEGKAHRPPTLWGLR
jgi:hypothetical protein